MYIRRRFGRQISLRLTTGLGSLLCIGVIGTALCAPPGDRSPSAAVSARPIGQDAEAPASNDVYIGAGELRVRLSEANGGQVVIVDVRNKEAFSGYHIENAINLQVFEIKTKTFLRRKPLVLVGDPIGGSAIEREVRSLRDHGFTEVSVLRGGIPAWLSTAAEPTSDQPPLAPLKTVRPIDYYQDASRHAWTVIDLSDSGLPSGLRVAEPSRSWCPQSP